MLQWLGMHDQWIKDHQVLLGSITTLLGSFIALLGLLCGYMLNAHLNRRQQDRIRHQDAVSLAAALASEINSLRDQAISLLHALRATSAATSGPSYRYEFDAFLTLQKRPPRFVEASDKIGLLGPQLAFHLSDFYFSYYDAIHKIERLTQEQNADDSAADCFSLQAPLERICDKGIAILPDLLAFAHSRKPQPYTLDWLVKAAKRTDTGV